MSPRTHEPNGVNSALESLRREPCSFEFAQAVRLLRALAHQRHRARSSDEDRDSDDGAFSRAEVARFRAWPALSFPASPLVRSDIPGSEETTGAAETASQAADARDIPSLTVAFMGLFGPLGVLPRHYTQLVIDRVRQKDYALRDFLDLFNHRLILHFYEAWAKYRLPIVFEQAVGTQQREGEDPFTRALFSFVGMETQGLRGRLDFSDRLFLYYSGHFSHFPRNAISLEAILTDYFQVAAVVQQLHGQWLYLDTADQSRLSAARRPTANNQLGQNTVVGERVWGIENSFRIRLGPLRYRQFQEFLPASSGLARVEQLVESYVGRSFVFDIQLVLRQDEVPQAQLSPRAQPSPPSRLGWNTWVHSQPMTRHRDDAVFMPADGSPPRDSV